MGLSILQPQHLSMKIRFLKRFENKSAEEIKDYLVARAQEVFEEKSQQLNGKNNC